MAKFGVSGVAITAILAGSIFAYSGIKGLSISTTARDLLSGKNPADDAATTSATTMPGTGGSVVASGSTTAIGQMLAAKEGWTGNEWSALNSLWQRESGWSATADTRVSGLDAPNAKVFAYGIAQARPATKYPKRGQPPDLGGVADPTVQIQWGIGYIKGRYGTPSAALAHENADGNY